MPSEGRLISLAKKAISSYFTGEECKPPLEFNEKQGVFVTLKKQGKLRGCIGFAHPIFPLSQAVIKSARAAAFQDPRFPPLRKEELKEISIEITVLSKPELITVEHPEEYFEKIEIGRDGLIVRSDKGTGLLLPQVFSEYESSPLQALQMTCEKAGIAKDEWMNPETRIFRFQGRVIKDV